jgi:hypothetical protein
VLGAGLDTCVCIVIALLLRGWGDSHDPSPLNHLSQNPSGVRGTADEGKSRENLKPHVGRNGHIIGSRTESRDDDLGSCPPDCAVAPHDTLTGETGDTSRSLPGGFKVSKDDVRRQLAVVSASYPPARPSRGMLKQVYNFCQSG